MSKSPPRLRMFAGPNGSGKTTVKMNLNKPAHWFGVYLNPDDLEAEIRRTGQLSLATLNLVVTSDEIQRYFAQSHFLQSHNLHSLASQITCPGEDIDFGGIAFNSYLASVLADFLRRKALDDGRSLSFETVMSHPDKVEFLKEAQGRGFRTYLYFIATEDPEINIQRVKNRVTAGGHDVPVEKIVDRYHRSLQLLGSALRYTHRAFLFDTSEAEPWYVAEVTNGQTIELKRNQEIPSWFEPVWNQFQQVDGTKQ
jgi:predicted ABC-type ATPase